MRSNKDGLSSGRCSPGESPGVSRCVLVCRCVHTYWKTSNSEFHTPKGLSSSLLANGMPHDFKSILLAYFYCQVIFKNLMYSKLLVILFAQDPEQYVAMLVFTRARQDNTMCALQTGCLGSNDQH